MRTYKIPQKLYFPLLIVTLVAGASFAAPIQVAPNPWIPTDGKTITGNYTGDGGSYPGGVVFRNLPGTDGGEIFIYTASGELVNHFTYAGTLDNTGTANWKGRDENGSYVASGLYLWIVKTGDDTTTGKLLVIR